MSARHKATAKDMTREDWRGLMQGFFKFLFEESQEPEHAEETSVLTNEEVTTKDADLTTEPSASSAPSVAGVMMVAPKRRVLFVKRTDTGDHSGTWCFPGGSIEPNELPADCAARKTREEVGYDVDPGALVPIDEREIEGSGVRFSTYLYPCETSFQPHLNEEHSEYIWAPYGEWPTSLHPGVAATLENAADLEDIISDVVDDPTAEDDKLSSLANDPLTNKGEKILTAMKEKYGEEKGEKVFYASRNKGTIKGVDEKPKNNDKFGEIDKKRAFSNDENRGIFKNNCVIWKSPDWKPMTVGRVLAEDRAIEGRTRYDRQTKQSFIRLALDFSSVRRKDEFGRLHISVANLSKAAVNSYYGWEIVDHEELGLEPSQKYMLLRDPEELKAAAPSFNNVQLLTKHVPVSSDAEGGHQPDQIIGSTGTDARFDVPYLRNSLVVWDKEAIGDIENDRKRELSCSYSYKPDMTSGTYEGQHYDGVMRNIVANHVALVREGRAGSDVVIGDKKLMEMWQAPRFTARMAMDAVARDAGTSVGARKAAATRKANGNASKEGGKHYISTHVGNNKQHVIGPFAHS